VLPELAIGSRVWRRLGPFQAVLWFMDRWVRKVIPFRILVVVTHSIDGVNPIVRQNIDGLDARFLTPQDVRNFARDEDGWYSPAFACQALAMGDQCLGVIEGRQLLSYCWYSSGPTPAFDEIVVTVGPRYRYSYKAYTDVEHRGRGLHSYGVAVAAEQLAADGDIQGIVAYIEASNVASLLSAQKIGDDVVGFVFLCRIAGRLRSFATPGCAKVGFRVHQP